MSTLRNAWGRAAFLLTALLILGLSAGARAESVATVIRIQGEAQASDQSGSRPLAIGDPVQRGDRLTTGIRSRLEIHFRDGMELVLSDGAAMTVSAFEWAPASSAGKAELTLAEGAFLLQTGAVGKLPDHPLTVKTPLASVGVRGTRFWGGPMDAPFNLLLIEGKVVVSTPAGSVDLTESGQGTMISGGGEKPQPPSYWGEERIRRAFATVSFE
ncbi:MAG: FecR domain-containing protein [Magnetospirillum sp.]|nr:FecR domain-containing protein [Magnetospirillum sp.]